MSETSRRCNDCNEVLKFHKTIRTRRNENLSFYRHDSYCPVLGYSLRNERNTYTEEEDLPLELDDA